MALLFIGTPDENEPVSEILSLMGGAAKHCVNSCDVPPRLDLLPAILALSEGYLGRDTGPMHIAAALRRPVLAVFGGGTWPRFIPAALAGAALTCAVPCSGCGWNCHFDDSHCVKDVPIEPVIQELRRTIAGRGGFRTIVFEADTKRLEEMGLEAATLARARLRRLNGELIGLRANVQAARAEGYDLQQQLQLKASEATDVGEQLRQAKEQFGHVSQHLELKSAEAMALGEQLGQANQQIAEKSLEAKEVAEQLRDANEQLRRANQQIAQKSLEAIKVEEQLRQANQQVELKSSEATEVGEQLRHTKQQFEQKSLEVTEVREQLRQANEQMRYVNQQVEQKSLEAANLEQLLESIRRSVFTRLLVALRIWRVFRHEGPDS